MKTYTMGPSWKRLLAVSLVTGALTTLAGPAAAVVVKVVDTGWALASWTAINAGTTLYTSTVLESQSAAKGKCGSKCKAKGVEWRRLK